VLRVGLTGGIGSGKSTVAAGLGRRGALVIDADRIAREVVEPDAPAYAPLVERFGPGILRPDRTLDRPALAAVVFSDPDALTDLNRITHPAIGAAVLARAESLEARAGDGAVIVFDQPLLNRESIRAYRLGLVVVVDTPTETAVARLVEHRGFTADDAWARVAAQMDRDERVGLADIVVDNDGGVDALEDRIDRLWEDLRGRAAADPTPST
jgi:dephospho-CoA kinase